MALESRLLSTVDSTPPRSLTVRSLTFFLLSNLIWPLIIIFLFPSAQNHQAQWAASISSIHFTTLASSYFMGLAGWLYWADGGFSAQKSALHIYISQISAGVTWHPAVLGIGSAEIGWVVCLVNFGFLVFCFEKFGKVNEIAGGLVMVALVSSGYVSYVTCYLVFP